MVVWSLEQDMGLEFLGRVVVGTKRIIVWWIEFIAEMIESYKKQSEKERVACLPKKNGISQRHGNFIWIIECLLILIA